MDSYYFSPTGLKLGAEAEPARRRAESEQLADACAEIERMRQDLTALQGDKAQLRRDLDELIAAVRALEALACAKAGS